MKQVIFSNVVLASDDKDSLEMDEDGYYLLTALSFNEASRSATGDRYVFTKPFIDYLNDSNSRFNKVISERQLFGEWKHPDYTKCRNVDEKYLRCRTIEPNRFSIHIKDYLIENETLSDGTVKTSLKVWIKPFGPFKELANDALTNKNINVALSGRFFSTQRTTPTGVVREIFEIVTFDLVPRQGLPGCCRSPHLTQESEVIDMDEYNSKHVRVDVGEMSEESSSAVTHDDICNRLNIPKSRRYKTTSSKGIKWL